jgi:7,8-dihydro-6-hydroxymethylpterin-pyrophosphokinase
LLAFERKRAGAPYPAAPRTLDLYVILFDDKRIAEPDLIGPHSRFRDRLFVLLSLPEDGLEWADSLVGGVRVEEVRARYDA